MSNFEGLTKSSLGSPPPDFNRSADNSDASNSIFSGSSDCSSNDDRFRHSDHRTHRKSRHPGESQPTGKELMRLVWSKITNGEAWRNYAGTKKTAGRDDQSEQDVAADSHHQEQPRSGEYGKENQDESDGVGGRGTNDDRDHTAGLSGAAEAYRRGLNGGFFHDQQTFSDQGVSEDGEVHAESDDWDIHARSRQDAEYRDPDAGRHGDQRPTGRSDRHDNKYDNGPREVFTSSSRRNDYRGGIERGEERRRRGMADRDRRDFADQEPSRRRDTRYEDERTVDDDRRSGGCASDNQRRRDRRQETVQEERHNPYDYHDRARGYEHERRRRDDRDYEGSGRRSRRYDGDELDFSERRRPALRSSDRGDHRAGGSSMRRGHNSYERKSRGQSPIWSRRPVCSSSGSEYSEIEEEESREYHRQHPSRSLKLLKKRRGGRSLCAIL